VGIYPGDTRLRITEEGDEDRYFALSYCWGRYEGVTTTTANISEHEQRIIFGKTERLFKDVAEITRRLGVRYLW